MLRVCFFIACYIGYRFITAHIQMLFCCLWRNVETSCHKHFVVVSRQSAINKLRRLLPSDKFHNLPLFGGAVLITPSRSQRKR